MLPKPAQTILPRWRGFNLLGMQRIDSEGHFPEHDFRWISDWGFDFVRLPLSYWFWANAASPYTVKQDALERIDEAVRFGLKYRLHVCLNFHHAPGYCVSKRKEEPWSLWKDQEALDAFCNYWSIFARLYKGISSEQISFNLVNEPRALSEAMTEDDHSRVMRAAVKAIREIDPDRLIILDGYECGQKPWSGLSDLNVAQSTRAYTPQPLSHYGLKKADPQNPVYPLWPGMPYRDHIWDRAKLQEHYRPWIELAQSGTGVHCGEGGAWKATPRDVHFRWFRDVMEILKEANIGWALWGLRGHFGIIDTDRSDAQYVDWHGHQLDVDYLKLLQEF